MHYERKGPGLVNGGKSGHEPSRYEKPGYEQSRYDRPGYDQSRYDKPGNNDQSRYDKPRYDQSRYGQQNNDNRRFGNQQPRGKQGYSPKPPRPKPPKKESRIYFIALLPNAAVGKEIIRMKQEFAEFYDARKALKVLPYITVQVPFTADPVIEKDLCGGLTDFAAAMQPFDVELDGFGSVANETRRLIFFNVVKNKEIMHLHKELILLLRKSFGFSSMLAKYGFNPHISLALNDIAEGVFEVARQEYEDRAFHAAFKVNNMYLLRHSGTSWEVLHKCKLGGEA